MEVPHFASLRGKEREVVILRSDDGESWCEHTLEATEDAIAEALNGSIQGEGEFMSSCICGGCMQFSCRLPFL